MAEMDPELAEVAPAFPPTDLTDPDAAREFARTRAKTVPVYPGRDRLTVTERHIPGRDGPVPVRLYRPSTGGRPAAVLFLHGGAFIHGDLDSSDGLCARISDELSVPVLSVDYRLAPENRCPAALRDSFDALRWLVATGAAELGVDPGRIATAGYSAGGCLAAGVTLLARDNDIPLAGQLLLYPVLDDAAATPSSRELGDVPVFTAHSNALMWRSYLAGREPDGYQAPARMADLSRLPPTYLLAAGFDPLRDEALDYARRLSQAGVPVETNLVAGGFHGFDGLVPAAEISRRTTGTYVAALGGMLDPR